MQTFARVLPAVFLFACASAPQEEKTPDDPYAYTAERVAPGVTVLHQAEPFHVQPRGNTVLIEQGAGVVLIDSGATPAGAEDVIARVRATGKPVIAIALTHWHGDHTLGVSRLLEEWPNARVIATEATRAHLADPATDKYMPGADPAANARLQENIAGGVSYLAEQANDASLTQGERESYAAASQELARYGRDLLTARRVAPTETVADELVLDDPVRPVALRFLGRANTDGDLIAYLPRQRIVATGDVLVAPIPFGFNVYPEDWIGVLQKIDALDARVIVPGHGLPMRDESYLHRFTALLEAVRTKAAPIAAENLSSEAAASRVDISAERAGFVGVDPWLVRWFNAYWTGPVLTSALKEARGEPIVQGE